MSWEQKYLTGTLQEMPIKPITADSVKEEVEKLAEEFDANPIKATKVPAPRSTGSSMGRGRDRFAVAGYSAGGSIVTPTLPKIAGIEERVTTDILPNIDSAEVEDAFGSQVGFYVGHAHELRVPKMDVVNHLKDWATKSFGLLEAPYMSSEFLKKIGVGNDRRGSSRGGFGSRDRGFGGNSRDSFRSGGGSSRGGFGERRGGSSFGRDDRSFGRDDRSSGPARFSERENRGQTYEYIQSERRSGNPSFASRDRSSAPRGDGGASLFRPVRSAPIFRTNDRNDSKVKDYRNKPTERQEFQRSLPSFGDDKYPF